MKNRTFGFVCLVFLALLATSSCSLLNQLNQLLLDLQEVLDVRKSQVYLEKELDLYSRGLSDKYTLFLAVKNYADRLYALEVNTLSRFGNKLQNTIGNSYIGKILLGSSHNKQIYSFAKESSVDSSKQIMYFKRWRIDLNKIFQIQDNPSAVISVIHGRYLRENWGSSYVISFNYYFLILHWTSSNYWFPRFNRG